MKKGLGLLFLSLFCLAGTHVSAYSYEGEYSIDHMIRNYRFVSLGQYDYGVDYHEFDKISDVNHNDMLVYYNGNMSNIVDFRRLNNIIINQQKDIYDDNRGAPPYYRYIDYPGNFIKYVEDDYSVYLNSYNASNSYIVLNYEAEAVDLHPTVSSSVNPSNVIYNFINAKYIYIGNDVKGHIIAPKADVIIYGNNVKIDGSIIANNIYHSGNYTVNSYPFAYSSGFFNYDFNDIVDYKPTSYAFDEERYSIETLLNNYNLVAFGKNTTNPVDVYHIVGSFLINGNLGIKNKYFYAASNNIYDSHDMTNLTNYQNNELVEGMRLDMKSKHSKYASYINGKVNTIAYTPDTLFGSYKNEQGSRRCGEYNYKWCVGADSSLDLYTPLLVSDKVQSSWNKYSSESDAYILTGKRLATRTNYLDFNKLYTNVVKEQSQINRGSVITPNNGSINVTIGNNYTVNNINDIQRINFDNYKENESKLTVITINDSGEITMPVENIAYLGTNDYLGKTNIRYVGERILDEDYYGNIVFNIPNATKIKFPSGHAFKGHIIAPNARVEMPEMNIAGCLIVDSITAEDHSELHYYPLNNLPLTLVDSNKLRAQIVWADQNNKDAIRPSFVNLKVYVNGVVKYTQKVTAADDWMFEIQLNENDLGNNIELRVEQDGVEGYTLQVDKLSSNQFVITNTHVPGTVKGAEENPKTGIFKYTWIFIAPLLLLIPGFIYFNKNSFFKNINKK